MKGSYGLEVADHGGGCCGVMHLYRFPEVEATHDERVSWIKQGMLDCVNEYDPVEDGDADAETWKCCVEVVLAHTQLEDWRAPLLSAGFKEVFDFHNSNSGNRCHVFLAETGE